MAAQLDKKGKRVWQLHIAGLSMSQIAATLRTSVEYVHNTITGVWYDGGQVV